MYSVKGCSVTNQPYGCICTSLHARHPFRNSLLFITLLLFTPNLINNFPLIRCKQFHKFLSSLLTIHQQHIGLGWVVLLPNHGMSLKSNRNHGKFSTLSSACVIKHTFFTTSYWVWVWIPWLTENSSLRRNETTTQINAVIKETLVCLIQIHSYVTSLLG